MNFYTETICKDHRFGSLAVINDMALLEPVTRLAVNTIISEGALLNIHFKVTETYRSQARQHMLFNRHLTKLRKVGCHGFGLAADIMIITAKGAADPDGSHYDILRRLAEKHHLISGSDWGQPAIDHDFRDFDHVQRIAVKRQDSVFGGFWYPDSRYEPLADLGREPPEK